MDDRDTGTEVDPVNYIEQLYQDNLDFYSDEKGKGALSNIQQTFPLAWIYVAELIQNAVDEGASRLSFCIADSKTLIFEHNGNAFRPDDVKSLCTRGVSTKSVKTIGFMGVGFKSVFRSFEKVEISSENWKFYLEVPSTIGTYGEQHRTWLGCVLPRFNNDIQSPSSGMTCRFLMTKRLDDLQEISDDLEKVFGEDSTLLPLLALRGVEELTWNGREYLLSMEKRSLRSSSGEMIIVDAVCDSPNTVFHRWTVFSETYFPSKAAIKKFLEHREISPQNTEEQAQIDEEISKARTVQIFCEVNEQDIPKLPVEGRAFSVLPTQVSLPLRIDVQADWLLDISRKTFMDTKGNAWQQEILKQLPLLLKYFLEWLVDEKRPREAGWWEGYNILPVIDRLDQRSNLFDKTLLKDFANVLRDVKFLPILSENGYDFGSPQESRYLPSEADQKLNHKKYFPWILFGPNIVSLKTLGDIAIKSLWNFDLLRKLNSSDLIEYWRDDRIVQWLKSWNAADVRKSVYVKFLSILSSLITEDDQTSLTCFPTQQWDWSRCVGIWSSMENLMRLPADWQILGREQEIRDSLEAHLPAGTKILNGVIYFYIQRRVREREDREEIEKAKTIIDQIEEIELEDLIDSWWEKVQIKPFTSDKINEVVRFTRWVHSKQPDRRNLIRYVIAAKRNGIPRLLPIEETLLSIPYTGTYRSILFPDFLAISEKYYKEDKSSSPAEWRSFFENGMPRPWGDFSINFTLEVCFEYSDKARKWFDGKLPSLRATYLRKSFKNSTIDNSGFYEVNGTLPVIHTIEGDYAKANAFAQWLGENPEMLAENDRVIIAYIPYGTSSVFAKTIEQEMVWVEDLRKTKWVPGSDRVCHAPADVLAEFDKVRPDVPYADISSDLLETLQEIDILFGENIPQAAAISRFKIEAPISDITRIVELFEDMKDQIGENREDRQMAQMMLMECAFLPLPEKMKTPDGLSRVPVSRLVRTAGPGKNKRSNLFNWVVSLDDYRGIPEVLDFLTSIDRFLEKPIPTTTTFNQTLDFLAWVWSDNPPVEQVRGYIRSAYEYILQDVENDGNKERWEQSADLARVFTSAKRWLPPAETYYDDVQRPEVLKLIKGLETATQGHLGGELSTIEKVAKLLGLQPLSGRIEIKSKVGDEVPIPPHWKSHFGNLAAEVSNYLTETVEESDTFPAVSRTSLKRVASIQRLVYDGDIKVDERDDQCEFDKLDNVVLVKGHPDDFGPRLCEVLVDVWGLEKHGRLVAKMTSLLMVLDNKERFYKSFRNLRAFCRHEDMDVPTEEKSESKDLGYVEGSPSTVVGPDGKESEKGSMDKGKDKIASEKDNSTKKQKEAPRNEHRRRTNRIITYVYPVANSEDEQMRHLSEKEKERIDVIGNRAEEYVMEVLGDRAKRMPKNNPGYDIEFYVSESEVQYIEVKGIDGVWSELGVGITARQYEEARKRGNSYWLYVVEDTLTENPIIRRFQNPSALIGNYRFDYNWRGIEYNVSSETSTKGDLDPGRRVLIDGEVAIIEEIVQFGKLGPAYRVRYPDGLQETIRDLSRIYLMESNDGE